MNIEETTSYIKRYIGKDNPYISESTRKYISENIHVFTRPMIIEIYNYIRKLESVQRGILKNLDKESLIDFEQMLKSKILKIKLDKEGKERVKEAHQQHIILNKL